MKKVFPKMYALTKLGKVKWYLVEVDSISANKATMKCSTASSLTAKIQTNTYPYTEGKNIGRANETTPYEQAILEAESTIRKLKDEGYTETIPQIDDKFNTDAMGSPKPMLAKGYSSWKWDRVYVQPKLDGMRCLCRKVNGKIVFTTRSGKIISTLRHIESVLAELPDKLVLDGELYIHGLPLQSLVSAVKKENEDTPKIKYRLYDLAIPNINQTHRNKLLKEVEERFKLPLVPTYEVWSEEQMLERFSKFIEDGYEGAMIRVPNGDYEFGFRSSSLIKYKEFLDDEFRIINVNEATGRDAGTAVFECITNEQKPFSVRPKGTIEQRAQYLKDKDTLIGKMLTVKFQNYTEDKIPFFPVGIAVRDYE